MLLWGDRWWFAGTGHSKQFADLAQAVDLLVAHYASEPKPVRIRLLFQPDALQTVAVTCPQGGRATLAAAGQSAARTEYHWENILDRYDQLLRRLVTKPTGKIS